jgi:signal peptidase II
MTRKTRVLLAITLPVVIADIVTKRIALAELRPPHTPHEVLGEVLRFTLTFNQGAAMGLSLGAYSRWVFLALSLVASAVLVVFFRRAEPRDGWLIGALALLLGGAVGNLIDRVRWNGGVVDFIDVGIGQWRFWTFNVADSAVTVGAILLALVLWFAKPARDAPS